MNFLEALALKIGGGAIGGVICGFLAKQFIKLLVFLLAVYFGSIAYLQYRGYIKVYWEDLYMDLTTMNLPSFLVGFVDKLISLGVITASFLGGFYLGFRKG